MVLTSKIADSNPVVATKFHGRLLTSTAFQSDSQRPSNALSSMVALRMCTGKIAGLKEFGVSLRSWAKELGHRQASASFSLPKVKLVLILETLCIHNVCVPFRLALDDSLFFIVQLLVERMRLEAMR